jgi:hypothetical protein
LAEFTGFGHSANDNCDSRDLGWRDWIQPSVKTVMAGSSDTCGAWSVRCPGCETITAFFSDEVGCLGCDQKFELAYDHRDGEVEGVIFV